MTRNHRETRTATPGEWNGRRVRRIRRRHGISSYCNRISRHSSIFYLLYYIYTTTYHHTATLPSPFHFFSSRVGPWLRHLDVPPSNEHSKLSYALYTTNTPHYPASIFHFSLKTTVLWCFGSVDPTTFLRKFRDSDIRKLLKSLRPLCRLIADTLLTLFDEKERLLWKKRI